MSLANLKLWNRVNAELQISNRIVGGIPTDPKLIEAWIAARMPEYSAAEREAIAKKTVAELGEATEDAAAGMWTTFKRNASGIYIESRQIKAMIKEASNVMRELLTKAEAKAKGKEEKTSKSKYTNLRAKAAERIYVEADVVPLLTADGQPIPKPDGSEERPIHVMTPMGPRNALKRVDYAGPGTKIRFSMRYLADGLVDMELLNVLFEYAKWNGLGANRSQGDGRFEVLKLEEIA